MKFLLMMNVQGAGPYPFESWAPEDVGPHMAFLNRFSKQLADAGELVGIQALAASEHAKVVRAGADGRPITDGVFPESKEFLAGFWAIDVESPERAYALAAEASAAPGPGGLPMNMPIEVRQVMSAPSDDSR